MNKSQILLAAHYGAQKFIESEIDTGEISYNRRHLNLKYDSHELVARNMILKHLKDNGFGEFLLNRDDGSMLDIAPLWSAHRDDTSSWYHDGSWYHKEVFNVAEIEAYMKTSGKSAHYESALEYMKDRFDYRGSNGGPGRPFHAGTVTYQRRNRIIVESSGGIDC